MVPEMTEFERDRQLDPGQLDVEAVRQADRFFKYAEMSVQARAGMDRSKAQMELVEARLLIRCAEKPEQFGLVKTTEAAIKAAVKCHDDYITAQEAYFRAKETSGLLDRAVEAMEQRKRMLEVLITLHGQQYFAGPSVPRDLVSAWQESQAKGSAQVLDRQRARVAKKGKGG